MTTGAHTTGQRMLSACIMGYGIGIANAGYFMIGMSLTLFAFLWDWNRKRS